MRPPANAHTLKSQPAIGDAFQSRTSQVGARLAAKGHDCEWASAPTNEPKRPEGNAESGGRVWMDHLHGDEKLMRGEPRGWRAFLVGSLTGTIQAHAADPTGWAMALRLAAAIRYSLDRGA